MIKAIFILAALIYVYIVIFTYKPTINYLTTESMCNVTKEISDTLYLKLQHDNLSLTITTDSYSYYRNYPSDINCYIFEDKINLEPIDDFDDWSQLRVIMIISLLDLFTVIIVNIYTMYVKSSDGFDKLILHIVNVIAMVSSILPCFGPLGVLKKVIYLHLLLLMVILVVMLFILQVCILMLINDIQMNTNNAITINTATVGNRTPS